MAYTQMHTCILAPVDTCAYIRTHTQKKKNREGLFNILMIFLFKKLC